MFTTPLHKLRLKSSLAYLGSSNGGDRGFSMAEVVVTLAVVGILSAIVMPSIGFASRALPDSTNRLASSFKMARAKAMSQTSAYRLRPTAANSFIIERATNCAANATDWRTDGAFTVSDRKLDTDINLSAATENGQSRAPGSGWSLCFNSRGLANKDLVLTLQNVKDSKQKRIEVFPGGAVQVYDDDV